ncbi:polysialic acid transporter [Fischerella thermalis CCMEE 5273]|jgi:lipopolysaccharide transport system permease protein|uniref:ABC-2 type transporter n=1 Tax=Fischerella thermalis JSC-11 TaxID=741277 RepID=G6FN85_9CYAN|nr:ABC transporter permease [Fischerella thermalis]PMB03748.1 polysialic acid transporter [Fischerella thermalis CCMEE 5273]PMB07948.1 polysialic acid transporter [Fischerella thermalis CCMEE 5328]EHC19515.1 ABC-2 type transporter [Fischerella thermalis JSC-11]PMB13535.1 polysialic acid transporter [Fischerella thermalis CCMEE 5282]PMB32960.1 polysialic acid transporter [Fischerella thermalis CCMEE 5208]
MHSKHQLPEVIHTPESSLKHPLRLLQQMWRDLLASRELAWRLMVRDISAQYRQSFLGIAWAFLPPIVMAASFTLAKGAQVINVGVTDIPYPAYVMFSTALWQTFVEALNGPVQAVTVAKPMLARVNFPREALILAKLGEVFFNFGIKTILIVALFIFFRVSVSWTVIIAPVALIHLVLLGTFIGILLAPFGVLYQDVSKGLSLITGFWLFLTPVVYAVPNEGTFGYLVKLNPVTPLLVTTRELATTGVVSEPIGFWVVSAITIIGLLLTWIAFRLAMPFVVERVSS